MCYKVLHNRIRLIKKSIMQLSVRLRIVMPMDLLIPKLVCDFNSFKPFISKYSLPFVIGAILTDKHFCFCSGVQQHFQMFGDNVDK